MSGDVERLVIRVDNLHQHFSQAAKDIEDIKLTLKRQTGASSGEI